MGSENIVHQERGKKFAIAFRADDGLTHTAFVAEMKRCVSSPRTRPNHSW